MKEEPEFRKPYGRFRLLPQLDGTAPGDADAFPDLELAWTHPNGLLCVGGDLAPERLLIAYRRGIFPWYSEDVPLLWYSPDPREVLYPEQLRVPRTMRSTLRKGTYEITMDRCFRRVMEECAKPRPDQDGTWITRALLKGYCALHELGHAHSIESWCEGELVGGLYGVAIGQVFFGESMFARRDDASKVAFVHAVRQLQRWGYRLVDCQVHTPHLDRFGSLPLAREEYVARLKTWCDAPGRDGRWEPDGKGWEA